MVSLSIGTMPDVLKYCGVSEPSVVAAKTSYGLERMCAFVKLVSVNIFTIPMLVVAAILLWR